jgi:hypothetical protein
MEGRQRDEALESLDRLGLDSYWLRELEASVDDPMPHTPQPPIGKVALQELPEIFDGSRVIERRSGPRSLGDDTSGDVARREARLRVQPLDLASELQCEVFAMLGEDGELDARGAGVQNEDRVIRLGHWHRQPFSSQSPYRTRPGRAGHPNWPRGKADIAMRGCRPETAAKGGMPVAWQALAPWHPRSRMPVWGRAQLPT